MAISCCRGGRKKRHRTHTLRGEAGGPELESEWMAGVGRCADWAELGVTGHLSLGAWLRARLPPYLRAALGVAVTGGGGLSLSQAQPKA